MASIISGNMLVCALFGSNVVPNVIRIDFGNLVRNYSYSSGRVEVSLFLKLLIDLKTGMLV